MVVTGWLWPTSLCRQSRSRGGVGVTTFYGLPLVTYSASQDLPPTSLSLPKQPGISIKKHEPVGGNIADLSHDRDISLFCVPALEDVSVIF